MIDLLEMCDDENRKLAVETERQLQAAVESGSEFEDDFMMVTDSANKHQNKLSESYNSDTDIDRNSISAAEDDTDEYSSDEEESVPSVKKSELQTSSKKKRKADSEDGVSPPSRKKVAPDLDSLNSDSESFEDGNEHGMDQVSGDSENDVNSDNSGDGAYVF